MRPFVFLMFVLFGAAAATVGWHEPCTQTSQCAPSESGGLRECVNRLNVSSTVRTCEDVSSGAWLNSGGLAVLCAAYFATVV
jgi:hypothetical protein